MARQYMGKNEVAARRALMSVAKKVGVQINVQDWREGCRSAGINRQRFPEIFKSMQRKEIISVDGDMVSLVF